MGDSQLSRADSKVRSTALSISVALLGVAIFLVGVVAVGFGGWGGFVILSGLACSAPSCVVIFNRMGPVTPVARSVAVGLAVPAVLSMLFLVVAVTAIFAS